jgi:hypothetical protein
MIILGYSSVVNVSIRSLKWVNSRRDSCHRSPHTEERQDLLIEACT